MIDVKVMQSPQRVDVLKKTNKPFSSPTSVLGLIDTGASSSVLDRHVIASLGLGFHGVISIHTPSTGPAYETRNAFDACWVLGESQAKPLVLTLPVIECDLASEGFFAIIGRDVLCYCTFTYDGPKSEFALSFGHDDSP